MFAQESSFLLDSAIAVFNNRRQRGEITQRQDLLTKQVYEQFEYKQGSVASLSRTEFIVEQDWDIADLLKFCNELKTTTEYYQVLGKIQTEGKFDKTTVEQKLDTLLRNYASRLYRQAFKGEPVTTNVDVIAMFLGDLSNAPVMWHVASGLRGLWIDGGPIVCDEIFKLRALEVNDLEHAVPITQLAMYQLGFATKSIKTPAILECNIRAADPGEVQRAVQVMIGVLSLYDVGSIFAAYTDYRPDSILRGGSYVSGSASLVELFKYGLTTGESQSLREFYERISPTIKTIVSLDVTESSVSLKISYDRYQDALHQLGSSERRITAAITCLESLLLKGQERSELSHRLGQRTAVIMRAFGYKAAVVYRNVIDAYEIRSTYIHGSIAEKSNSTDLNDLLKAVMGYCRVCLLTIIQIAATDQKERMIRKLDNALLEKNAATKLEELLTNQILLPRMPS